MAKLHVSPHPAIVEARLDGRTGRTDWTDGLDKRTGRIGRTHRMDGYGRTGRTGRTDWTDGLHHLRIILGSHSIIVAPF